MSDNPHFPVNTRAYFLAHDLVQGFLAPFPEEPTENQRAAACVAANLLSEAIESTLHQFAGCNTPEDLGRVLGQRMDFDNFVPIAFNDVPIDPAGVVDAFRTLNDPPKRP